MAQGSFLSQEYAVKFIRDNPGLRKATEILSSQKLDFLWPEYCKSWVMLLFFALHLDCPYHSA